MSVKQIHSELYKKSVQNDLYSFPTKVSLNVSADVVYKYYKYWIILLMTS